jgi:tetrahydrodipicolinate N-succinyltransferase
MIDSHALVGSCAQIGKRVHLSAAAQIGGVLEPVNAAPVIIEDDVLVGGNCGVYEGTLVRARAVLGAGTILTRSTPLYDSGERRSLPRHPRRSARSSRECSRRPRLTRGEKGKGTLELEYLALHAGDREVPRRKNRPRNRTGRLAAITESVALLYVTM